MLQVHISEVKVKWQYNRDEDQLSLLLKHVVRNSADLDLVWRFLGCSPYCFLCSFKQSRNLRHKLTYYDNQQIWLWEIFKNENM